MTSRMVFWGLPEICKVNFYGVGIPSPYRVTSQEAFCYNTSIFYIAPLMFLLVQPCPDRVVLWGYPSRTHSPLCGGTLRCQVNPTLLQQWLGCRESMSTRRVGISQRLSETPNCRKRQLFARQGLTFPWAESNRSLVR